MAVHAVVVVPLVRRGWLLQGLVLGALAFLAVGLIYPPFASDYLDQPLGPFGSGFGASTVISLGVASLGFGIDRVALLRPDRQRGVVGAARRGSREGPRGG